VTAAGRPRGETRGARGTARGKENASAPIAAAAATDGPRARGIRALREK
jgi:hypothetical protein